MRTFRFLDFPVYQESKKSYLDILSLTENLNIHSLKDQIRRASLSVVLNISEGSAKTSDKDFARFLQNSLGSISETVSCLDILRETKFISDEVYDDFEREYESIAKQLGGFIKKLNKSK